MKKSFSLLAAAVMALGIVAFCGIGAKAEAQGLRNVGLRLGYNVNELETITTCPYRHAYHSDTTSTFSNYGGHLGAYAEVSLAQIDLGGEEAIVGIIPALQFSWTDMTIQTKRETAGDTTYVNIDTDIGALHLDAFLPVSFRYPQRGYAIIVEIGAFGKFFLLGDAPKVLKINDVLVNFDAGVMAGVAVEFGETINLGYRITSGFMEENVYSHFVSLGFNVWRNR